MAQQPDMTAYHFYSAISPPDWIICGVKLRPFCLGHYLLLQKIYNPMMGDEDEKASLEKVIIWFYETLLICAMNYEDGDAMLKNDVIHKRNFSEFTDNVKENMKVEKGWNIISKMALLREYITYFMDFPFYTEERASKPTAPSGTDWKQNLFVIFKKMNYTESEILNASMRKLFYEWCSFAEGEGAIKVMHKFDVEMLARAKGLI